MSAGLVSSSNEIEQMRMPGYSITGMRPILAKLKRYVSAEARVYRRRSRMDDDAEAADG